MSSVNVAGLVYNDYITMRLPTRRSNKLKKSGNDVVYLTQEGIDKLQNTLKKLKSELPQAIEDVRITGEFGDFSENAEYQEAKHRMRRTRNRILSIEGRLKSVVLIDENSDSDVVVMGSVVMVLVNSNEKELKIVGPYEADPMVGKISYISPIGRKLMSRAKGDDVVINLPNGREIVYKILSIK